MAKPCDLTIRRRESENHTMRKLLGFFLIFSLIVASYSEEVDAARRRRRRAPRAKAFNEKKLYERIGGAKAFSEIVDEWIRLNLADGRVAGAFSGYTQKPERLGRLRRSLGDQLCEVADGPCQYKGSPARKLRETAQASEDQFLIVSDNLFRSMQKFSVPEREKNELLARMMELRPEILGEIPAK